MDNQRLIKYLNQLLANTVIMKTKLLRYYWYGQGSKAEHLRGIFFNAYSQFSQQMLATGERILAIDGKPLATLAKYRTESTLEEASAEQYLPEMMEQFENDLQQLTHDMAHEGLYLANHLDDQQTYQVLTDFLQLLEQQLQQVKAYRNN